MSGIDDIWKADLTAATKKRMEQLKEALIDGGNHICPNCGHDLSEVETDGCRRCYACGNRICGDE